MTSGGNLEPTLAGVMQAVTDLKQQSKNRFDSIDTRLVEVESRLGLLESSLREAMPRLGEAVPRVGEAVPRIGEARYRFDGIEARLTVHDQKISVLQGDSFKHDLKLRQADNSDRGLEARVSILEKKVFSEVSVLGHKPDSAAELQATVTQVEDRLDSIETAMSHSLMNSAISAANARTVFRPTHPIIPLNSITTGKPICEFPRNIREFENRSYVWCVDALTQLGLQCDGSESVVRTRLMAACGLCLPGSETPETF